MFWSVFVSLCSQKGVSPNGVCADLGLSSAIATKWKKGSIPRLSTLKRIADYFGVTVNYLLGKEYYSLNNANTIQVLLYRITMLAELREESLNTVFINSGVGKNFKSNMNYANPSLGKITMLANYFGVTVDYLLGKEDTPTPSLSLTSKEMELIELARNLTDVQLEQLLVFGRFLCSQ